MQCPKCSPCKKHKKKRTIYYMKPTEKSGNSKTIQSQPKKENYGTQIQKT